MENDVYYLNNGYPMPKIGLGVYKITDNEMATAIESALEVGYRAFDTCLLYTSDAADEHRDV